MHIAQASPAGNYAPKVLAAQADLSERLSAIRAQINELLSAPYAFGREGPHRRARDLDILRGFAADAFARLVAKMEAGQ
jgi:hypothetical protein